MLDDEYLSGVLRVRVTSANGLKAKSCMFKQILNVGVFVLRFCGYFEALCLNCVRTVCAYISVNRSLCVCVCVFVYACA